MRNRLLRAALVCAIAMLGSMQPEHAAAQAGPECGEPYEIRRGDSLYEIARRLYGTSSEWSRIFYANRETLGADPAKIFPGQTIVAPCEASESEAETLRADIAARSAEPDPVAPEAEVAASETAAEAPSDAVPSDAPAIYRSPVSFLTADDYRPFVDRSLPAGGMIAEIVAAAMRDAQIPHEIVWIDDRAAHFDPLLSRHLFDFGFPWTKPHCGTREDDPRCTDFLYSDAVFEVLIKFFVLRESDFVFETDSDIEGRTLCRPAGFDSSDLDAEGRNWIADGKAVLIRPKLVRECFELLLQGRVDAVSVNEFTGREAIAQLEIGDEVTPAFRAVSAEPLHVVIAKRHPRASVLMFRFNKALQKLQESGSYKQIVSDHLALFWRDNG